MKTERYFEFTNPLTKETVTKDRVWESLMIIADDVRYILEHTEMKADTNLYRIYRKASNIDMAIKEIAQICEAGKKEK